MAEVVQGTPQEFWSPPVATVADEVTLREAVSAMAEVCPQCGTEFLMGSRFCHACGIRRPETMRSSSRTDSALVARFWHQAVDGAQLLVKKFQTVEFPGWMRYLHFHEIQRRSGLSTASLIAFLAGLGCIAGALLVGFITTKNFNEWQAVQLYRGEWLLAATASFVAGILLKKQSREDSD